VSFRVWAPRRKKVEVVLETGAAMELHPEPAGYFSGIFPQPTHGDRYRFRLDDGDRFPDPASRFQPEGPHGPSEAVDPARFLWTDGAWPGASLEGQVIYEMHLGTFTSEGTWEAARRELPELASIGITVVEIMPVADFPGRFGWGYDGVGLFAPVAIYGAPDDFRRFVDDAHRLGVAVILDVVYNHIGNYGNYLAQFSEDYFSRRHSSDWGGALNFDAENAAPVREWVTTNVAYWAEEYHLDGLRLDATQQIFDDSPEHIMAALAKSMRAAAHGRKVFIVAENEPEDTMLLRACEAGGYGLDGLWNDDFHHSARVAVTGRNEAYYSDFLGKPQELISAAKYGCLYQGQRYSWQARRRGAAGLDLNPARFVTYVQNHDQVANSGRGQRLHRLTSPGRLRAITALLLLAPGTPLLFQGQEFASSSPFFFFADHEPDARAAVWEGRIQSLTEFPSLAQPEMRPYHLNPGDPATFQRSKLDLTERQSHAEIYQFHKDLLQLRRDDPVFRAQSFRGLDGAVLSNEAFVLRYFGGPAGRPGDDRILIVNLGRDLKLDAAPEPLLAPPAEQVWEVQWSSEAPGYGGSGTAPVDSGEGWRVPGHAAVVMSPAPQKGKWEI
jgi:maltooligosyltrehalose trehalohydrolase